MEIDRRPPTFTCFKAHRDAAGAAILAMCASSAARAEVLNRRNPIAPPPVVAREGPERYVGCYALSRTIMTVGLTDNDRLKIRRTGQSEGPPSRAVGTHELAAEVAGARVFELSDTEPTRIASRYAGSEVIGMRVAKPRASSRPAGRETWPR